MDQQRPIPTERLRTIRGQMVERFSLDELRDLTFDLGINWDQLPGSNLSVRITELLELLNRQTQLPRLLARLEALRPDDAWALDDLDESAVSPYKGLEFYAEADAELFFGRERLIATLLDALRGQSFLAVVGASGSGKSSVVRAGVVPVLKEHRPPPDGAAAPRDSAGWAYLEMTPTDKPLEQLALTLTRDLATVGETRAILRDVAEDANALHLYLRKYLERQKKPRAFLLVDQFEELFTLCKDEPARVAFIDGLLGAADGGATTVVITLRADFYHHCLRYPGLRDALQQRQQLIGAMSEAELRAAVARPAADTGYELEPGLADKIVRDAGDEDGALPLLSHALLETWRRREGRRLTHFGYNEAGGVGGAIARTAEQTYNALQPEQQAIARRILLQLTELGEGAEDTRRVVGLANLLAGDAAARSEAETVLNALSKARLVTTDDQGAKVQVTHEALIREWPALQEWLRDNREALRLERRLEAAATEWSEGGRDASYLYDGAQLAAAREWAAGHKADLNETMRDFLDAATAEEEREAAEWEAARRQRERLTRRAFVGVSVFAALAALAAVFALLQRNAAIYSEARAVAARVTADYNEAQALIERDNAVAAQATSTFNETQAKFERDKAMAAFKEVAGGLFPNIGLSFNDTRARQWLNLSEDTFESDPLLADRLLLEAAVTAESNQVVAEVIDKLAGNLAGGRMSDLITSTVDSFTEIHTNALYAVDYSLGKDEIISGVTGARITTLSGDVAGVSSILNSPFFVVDYVDAPAELRRTDDLEWAVALQDGVERAISIPNSPFFVVDYVGGPRELRRADSGEVVGFSGQVVSVFYPPDSPFFIVNYSDAPDELRWKASEERVVAFGQDVEQVNFIPDSSLFIVNYVGAPSELRRTDDVEWTVVLSEVVDEAIPIPDSPFFVVDYSNASAELRRTDSGEVVALRSYVSNVVPIIDSTFFVVAYGGVSGELRRTDGSEVITLNDNIEEVIIIPHSPFFLVDYLGAPGELRRADGSEVVALSEFVDRVNIIPDSPFFIVDYLGASGQLRRTDGGEVIVLNGEVDQVLLIPDSPSFVVDYVDAPGELRRADGSEAVTLNEEVDHVTPIRNSPFFVVRYSDAPRDELHWADNGQVVTDAWGVRIANYADVLGTADDERYTIYYQDGTAEIVRNGRPFVDLGTFVEQTVYFPGTNRVAVLYADGRVNYIDLNLLEAIGGADAAETLAAMSPEELVAFTCETLFTDNPEWDEARLDEYLAFLPEGRACGD